MIRKQSSCNKQHQDPWKNKNHQEENSEGQDINNKHNQELPDLDDIFRKLGKKLSNFGKNKDMGSGNRKHLYIKNFLIGFVVIASVIIWIISGFYTIKEAERGVVIRLGKFSHLVKPGLNWKLSFIDEVKTVNVELVRELAASGIMLTSDENVVHVEMNVQYRVTQPNNYLFSVTNGDDSLRQATDSALRGIIGRYSMDRILTEGRTVIRNDTQYELEKIIRPYNMGITVLDVNFQAARPPDEVKAAFDDAIAARENEQQYIREAEAYANEVQPHANGKAQRILEEARAYCIQTILKAQGEVSRFAKLLPEYKAAPEITRKRLYMETMEKVLSHTHKILVNEKKEDSNFFIIPLEKILKSSYAPPLQEDWDKHPNSLNSSHNQNKHKSQKNKNFSSTDNDIVNQRQENTKRNDH